MMKPKSANQGQIIVIFAISLLALLFFIGLAIDAGSVYITYGSLKRTVDSASIAAANEFKRDANMTDMTHAAEEVFQLMNVDFSTITLDLCDKDKNGIRDSGLPPQFEARCPDTADGEAPRKLVWLQATQNAPLYFLTLLGFHTIPLTTSTISEAAPLDVVIVLDTSESMASATSDYYNWLPYDPSGCNGTNTCHPMLEAKEAAKALINTLAEGYDQVSVVSFDSADTRIYDLGLDLTAAKDAIDDLVVVNDDPPVLFKVWAPWRSGPNSLGVDVPHAGSYNPMNSEDLDGDGLDYDDPAVLGYTCPWADHPDVLEDRWWTVDEGAPDPFGWGGVPCDRDNGPGETTPAFFDSLDWNDSGIWEVSDQTDSWNWARAHTSSDAAADVFKFSALSTCSGCGLRQGANQLRNGGRFGSVWVMVFLSDGAVNLSDVHATYDEIPDALKNGFCGGEMSQEFWSSGCRDYTFTPRYCFDTSSSTCPPGSIHTDTSPQYSVLNYAMDMVDSASLTKSTNSNEPRGNEIAIYSIGLNVDGGIAEDFLRYMAAVGDDGDRQTDPCSSTAPQTSCGQYYYAPSGARLLQIFEDIAARIYTRINQ